MSRLSSATGSRVIAVVLLLTIVALASSLLTRAPRAVHAATAHAHTMVMMSDAEMGRMVDAWFATHPATGRASADFPVDTFVTSGVQFDADGNLSTLIDTVRCHVGDAIMWRRTASTHTTTSGLGASDPLAGVLWDQPLNAATPNFTRTFDTEGTFKFFCAPHESFGMKGVIIVQSLVGVPPGAGPVHAGFVSGPTPNPSHGGVSFRFALSSPGHARAEVFDVRGRRVATVLDRAAPAGEIAAQWDGGTTTGERASAGVYYLRLSVPGFSGTRRIVIEE